MPSCPTDELLTGFLANALRTAESDAVVRHVERCTPCQESLARLTDTPDTEQWRLAGQPVHGSGPEDRLMRRLKRAPSRPAPAPPARAVKPPGQISRVGMHPRAAAGSEWP